VRRLQHADLERLAAVIGAEDVVHDQHLAVVQRADPDALAAAGRQRVRPVERSGAQLVAVEIGAAHVQQRRAELVLARLLVLLDESDRRERAQDSVHRRLRQVELTGQLDHAQPPIASRQQPEDRGSTLDRLNSGGQRKKLSRTRPALPNSVLGHGA